MTKSGVIGTSDRDICPGQPSHTQRNGIVHKVYVAFKNERDDEG